MPKVSVIIPAYNAELFLGTAIESVLNQDYEDFELVIIDDASTDGSFELAQLYAARDRRVRVLRNSSNAGIGLTRALGVSIARGEYIAWLDADDIAISTRLSLQADFLDENPEVGIVGGAIQFFDGDRDLQVRTYALDDETLRKKMFRQNPVASPAAMVRASVFSAAGNYRDMRVCEDLEMYFRAGEICKFGNIPELVTRYRQVDSSLTRQNLHKMERVALNIRMSYRKSSSYQFTYQDWLFIVFQLASIWMPLRIRIWAFSIIRGDSKPADF